MAFSQNPDPIHLAFLIFGAIFPDLDVFAKEHRSYLHSFFLLLPLFLLSFVSPYLMMFSLGILSHLLLDMFSGVIPFFYPIKRIGYGVEILAHVKDFSVRIDWRVVKRYPDPKIERTLELNRTIPLGILALIMIIKRFS
ncbi:hypothetical protein Py04_0248 [Pyrococcus sp. ST04]|nr:hypothetical protein Py04_0248 [Pyrococcus sp. ST04]